MKKTKNSSSEPSSDNLTSEAAELKKLITSGTHKANKALWKRIKSDRLPKDLEKLFLSLSAKIPLRMLIWYVNRYKPDGGADYICNHPQRKPTSPAKAGCGPLSRRNRHLFPKDTRPFVVTESYRDHPVEPNIRQGHFVIMSYLQSNPPSISIGFAWAIVRRGYISEIRLLLQYSLPNQMISKLAKMHKRNIAELAANATVAN